MLASNRLARPIVALALAACLSAGAHAAVVTATLPDFNGPEHESGFPIDLGVVGTFSFVLPADAVISAALFSGVYGTALPVYTTAGYDVEIEGETIVVCAAQDPGCAEFDGPVFRPFSLTLDASTFDGLLDGLADLRVIQTDAFNVRMGSPTLSIEYQRVPSPGTAWLAVLALAMAGWTLHRGRVPSLARPWQRRPRPGADRVAAAARPGSGPGRVAGPALVVMVAVWLALLSPLLPLQAAAAPIVSAEVVTVGAGDAFAIDIQVADAVDLVSWQLDLGFDPAIVQATAVSEGTFLSSSGSTLFTPGVIDNAGGLVSLTSASFVDLAPPSGNGVLMTVEFIALGPGVSALALSNVFVNWLDTGFALQDGQITVVGDGGPGPDPDPNPVPEPTSLVLIATGLWLLHAQRRRPRSRWRRARRVAPA